MKPQKDHSTGNSGSSAVGHTSEAVNEGLVNGYHKTIVCFYFLRHKADEKIL